MKSRILTGDALATLRTLRPNSVDCCVTSPPYFGLRDYGVSGQIGLEKSPEAFVSRLADVFDGVHRVLKPEGTLWLNLGDSYAAGKAGRTDHGSSDTTCKLQGNSRGASAPGPVIQRKPPEGLKPKDLIGIPWMVAFELRKRGWYLRSDIIWHKPNPMPESVRDRPTKAHEYLFLLSKSEKYFYDADEIREPLSGVRWKQPWRNSRESVDRDPAHLRYSSGNKQRKIADSTNNRSRLNTHMGSSVPWTDKGDGRNRRSVWSVATRPYKGAHFATFPPKLIEPCILAGCPVGGTVLDPFSGAGTTGLVAQQHGRGYIGIELNPEYVNLQEARLGLDSYQKAA